jgi:hypothetical protein
MADALHNFFPIHLFDDVPFFCISDVNLILLTICTSSVSLWLCGNQSFLIKLTHWGTIFDIFYFNEIMYIVPDMTSECVQNANNAVEFFFKLLIFQNFVVMLELLNIQSVTCALWMLMEEALKLLLKTTEDLQIVWRFWKLQFMNAEIYVYTHIYMCMSQVNTCLTCIGLSFDMAVSVRSRLVNVFVYVVLMSIL